MLIDHTAVAFYPALLTKGVYSLMRLIARPAFPIFAFFIAVGARKTHDIKKYLLRLFAYALLSEIPFDHAFGFAEADRLVDFRYQNVFFTLAIGMICCWAAETVVKRYAKDKKTDDKKEEPKKDDAKK